MLQIKTNKLTDRKLVEIDGHPYTIRKMGNIEQLNISQSMRRLNILAEKEKTTKLSEREEAEVEQITNDTANTFISLFDDGGDQSKSKALVSSLSEANIAEILEQVFADEIKKDESEKPA